MGKSTQEAKQQDTEVVEQPQQIIADRDTMTFLSVTLGDIIDAVQEEQDANKTTIETLNTTISEKNTAIEKLTGEVCSLKAHLEARPMVKVDHLSAVSLGTGVQRLPNGSVRIAVDLDRDEVLPLVDQAEGAGEDLGEYLRKTVKESLLVYTS